MHQKKILILSANPIDSERLRLDEEIREIEEGLKRSQKRDHFSISKRSAVRVADLRRALLDEDPNIVHFSGHGDVEGLTLEDDEGKAKLVSKEALSALFKLFPKIECVVLNSCYSSLQADAIHEHIQYVIGMRESIGDRAAIEFAVGFYDAIGAGRSYEDAYAFGRNAIQLEEIPEDDIPFLHLASSPTRTSAKTAAHGRRTKDIVILSCSAHKRSDGETIHPRKGGVSEIIVDPEVAKRAIETRAETKDKIQKGLIDGTEFQEGNRAARPQNRDLVYGPDFGGKMNEPVYLPAFWRYMGRTYITSREEWEYFNKLGEDIKPSVLIISGLYGLIPVDEHIQNYDVHLTDRDQGSEPNRMVRDYWNPVVTEVLLSHFDWIEAGGWQLGTVVDLISERSYQLDIDWDQVYPRTRVLHRVFEQRAGRDALANIGILVRSIIRDPSRLSGLEADRFYDEPDFFNPDRVAFETSLDGSPLNVSRE